MKPYLIHKVTLLVAFTIMCMIFQSCDLFVGADGDKGQVFLSIDWIDEPEYYTDTNPSIPESFERRYTYNTDVGEYDFEFAFEDEYGWSGTYTIREAEPGESGRFFRIEGDNGRDAHYSLLLTYHGMIIENEYKSLLGSENVKSMNLIQAISGNYIIEIYMAPFGSPKMK